MWVYGMHDIMLVGKAFLVSLMVDGDLAPLSHTCWWIKVLGLPIALTTMHSGWMSITSSGCRSYLRESFFLISHLGYNIM